MRKKAGIEKLKVKYGRMFVLPWTIGMLLFFIVPLIKSIAFAFSDLSLVDDKMLTFVGVKHFKYLLQQDPNFVDNMAKAVTSFVYSLPIIVALSLIFAKILNQKFRGRLFARAVFFLPVIIASGVVMQYIIGNPSGGGEQLLATNYGSGKSYSGLEFDQILVNLGLPQQITDLLSDYISRIFNLVWSCGIQILLFVAGMQSIPDTMYEVSKIEGATAWEEFWFVTFPMLGNTIFLVLVYTTVDLFTAFDNPIMRQAYELIGQNAIYDRSAAVLWGYFIIVGIIGGLILLAYNRILMRKWN